MTNLFLLASLLVTQIQEPICWNCIKSVAYNGGSAQATITLSLEIISTHSASINVQQVDLTLNDVYRVAMTERVTGIGYTYNISNEYLVIDDFKVLKDERQIITALFLEKGGIDIVVPELVLAYEWPKNTSNEEIVKILKNRNNLDINEVLVRR